MTQFAPALSVRILGALVGSVLWPFGNVAYAQASCTAAPPAPASASASVTAQGTSTRPALVTVTWAGVPTTGANAAASYFVEVGSARGATDIAQFNTATTAVSSRQPANNGTYYVRVRAVNTCGRSGPSPEHTVTVSGTIPAGEPAALITAGVYVEDGEGDVAVVGEIRGSWGARAAAAVQIEGTFLGADGQPVGTDFTYAFGRSRRDVATRIIDDTTLGAGESGCFLMFTTIPIVNVSSVIAVAKWEAARLETLRGDVVVQNLIQDADASGSLVLRGQARNARTVSTYLNQVNIELRDTENQVGLCDFEFVQGSVMTLPSGTVTDTALAAGQVGSFVNFSGAPRAEVGRVATWTSWEEADTGPTTPASTPLSWHRLVTDVRAVPVLDAEGRSELRNAAIQRLRRLADGK